MLIDELKSIVGKKGWKTDERDLEPHVSEWRNVVHGKTPILVMPKTVEQVSSVVRVCHAEGVGIVPQGGNTGMCAGAVPDDSGSQVILSLSRMNTIRNIDPIDFSMVVEAGCILEAIQEAAIAVDRQFPLSLGAEGSCQIGGNLSTNAGGINVIRYGTARDLVLGLEVVLADGRILSSLRTLRKNTAGYDLKQLFVGSEGTLGIITAAALRLFPRPANSATALIALSSANSAVTLLGRLRTRLSDRIESFEIVSRLAFAFVERHIPDSQLPFDTDYNWYVLVETSTAVDDPILETALMTALTDGLADDIVIAKSNSEAEKLWRMRHSISEAQKKEAPILKHDIAVPIGSIERFLEKSQSMLAEFDPDIRLVAFGHVGDGNLHFNVAMPAAWSAETLSAKGQQITAAIYDLVAEMGGSFSAEHGVGILKKPYLEKYADPTELELMRVLKKALDPANILNPGKVI